MKKYTVFGLLGLGIVGYLATKSNSISKGKGINNKLPSPAINTAAEKAATAKAISQVKKSAPDSETGKLSITVNLRVSSGEKFAIGLGAYGGESGLKDKVNKFAQDIIPTLNKGPIPKIVSKAYPKSFKATDDGYQAIIAYMAMFHKGAKNEPVRKAALDYITKVLKSDKKFGNRIISVSAAKVP